MCGWINWPKVWMAPTIPGTASGATMPITVPLRPDWLQMFFRARDR